MTDTAARIVPVTDDHDTGGFFAAAARGELAVRVCSCGAVSHLPVAYCRECGGYDGSWEAVSGRGRLYSWTVVEHSVHPAFPGPYTVVMVELEDRPGVRLLGHLDGQPDLHADQPMQVTFDTVADGVVIPQWEPAG